ncbi:MAG: hypothetical protein WAN63_14535 [Candidatus Sulfotelmatobacter sp.]
MLNYKVRLLRNHCQIAAGTLEPLQFGRGLLNERPMSLKVDVAQRVDELLFLYTNIRLRHQRNKTTAGRIVPSHLPTDYNGSLLVTAQNCSGFGKKRVPELSPFRIHWPFGAHKVEGFLLVGSKNGDTLSLFEPKSAEKAA